MNFPPGREAGFSRSGVGDLEALEDDVHFRETATMSQAQKLSRRKAATISLVDAVERVLWRISIDMIIEAVREQVRSQWTMAA